MTQSQLLIEYILEYGSATPAKLTGTEYKDGFFGSEISRRARDLRKAGRLTSVPDGKFERFFLVDQDVKPESMQKTTQSMQNSPNLCKTFSEDCYQHEECMKTLDICDDCELGEFGEPCMKHAIESANNPQDKLTL